MFCQFIADYKHVDELHKSYAQDSGFSACICLLLLIPLLFIIFSLVDFGMDYGVKTPPFFDYLFPSDEKDSQFC